MAAYFIIELVPHATTLCICICICIFVFVFAFVFASVLCTLYFVKSFVTYVPTCTCSCGYALLITYYRLTGIIQLQLQLQLQLYIVGCSCTQQAAHSCTLGFRFRLQVCTYVVVQLQFLVREVHTYICTYFKFEVSTSLGTQTTYIHTYTIHQTMYVLHLLPVFANY